jgi:hypothetical protein
MIKKATLAAAIAATIIPSFAFAEGGTVSGAAGGAATGAIVGGPVGAAVGGVAGAALGTIMDPPSPEVREVVIQQELPSVQVQRQVIVGEPLPETVVLRPVPGYTQYTYAVVNNQRVIVDPGTRKVVQVVN